MKEIILDKKRQPPDSLKVVVFGASFGGFKALERIFSDFPEDLSAAIVVVQHIANGFMPELVNSFEKKNGFIFKIAQDGDRLSAGKILFAPPEFNMEIILNGRVKLNNISPGIKSSINILFSSAARVYKKNCIGVILTGMGDDGVEGIKDIKNAGGYTIAEAEKDCAIFGMPRLAIERGYINKVVRLDLIGETIKGVLDGKRRRE